MPIPGHSQRNNPFSEQGGLPFEQPLAEISSEFLILENFSYDVSAMKGNSSRISPAGTPAGAGPNTSTGVGSHRSTVSSKYTYVVEITGNPEWLQSVKNRLREIENSFPFRVTGLYSTESVVFKNSFITGFQFQPQQCMLRVEGASTEMTKSFSTS